MDKKEETRRLPGFYIALCCSVIAIGIAGYFTEKSTEERQSEGIVAYNEEQEEVAAANGIAENIEENASAKEDPPILEYVPEDAASENIEEAAYDHGTAEADEAAFADNSEDYAAANEPAEEAAVIVGTPTFTLPEGCSIAEEFSEELSYNSALGDWRTHNGVDISIDSGGSVSTIADGTVSEISSDEMGKFVVIEHDGGFESKYRGMSSVEELSVGDTVAAGSVIGIVTESRAENMTEPHLHLEMYKDEELVNPSDYLK